MRQFRRYLFLSGIATMVILSTSGCSRPSNPEAESAAAEAARQWLSLVDGGQYAESWEEGSDFFKAIVGKQDWLGKMNAIRKPMGATVSRKPKLTTYRTTMPGAPDGEYVIVQFASSFDNKKVSVETATLTLTEDRGWRIIGYFIK